MPGSNGDDGGDGHGPLILIVEDDPETRHFYVDALKLHGFRTSDASSSNPASPTRSSVKSRSLSRTGASDWNAPGKPA